MAGDWIKMRPSLMTSPKVNGIARILEDSRQVSAVLSTGFSGPMCEIVTRNVMRNVTVASLMIVWGAANEHTTDGIFRNADLSDIDDMVGIPGFGEAMAVVGWAEYDEEEYSVTLPNFNEYNTCGKDRAAEKNADRQRRYREKQKEITSQSNADSNVTNNAREEKRREDITPIVPSKAGDSCPHTEIIKLYHEHLPILPAVKVWNDKRKKLLQSRWREDPARQTLDYWERFFKYVAGCDFLVGKSGAWQADLEWLLNASNFLKVIEGKYQNREAA